MKNIVDKCTKSAWWKISGMVKQPKTIENMSLNILW